MYKYRITKKVMISPGCTEVENIYGGGRKFIKTNYRIFPSSIDQKKKFPKIARLLSAPAPLGTPLAVLR